MLITLVRMIVVASITPNTYNGSCNGVLVDE